MTEGKVSFDESGPQRLRLDGNPAINEGIERIFLACRGSLMVRAQRLDFDFYFSETFTECCQSIVARDLRNELLFLVEDEKFVMKVNARLVALARQFSSYVKIRVIPEEYIERQEMFIVSDATGYLHQPHIDHPRAFMDIADRGTARQLGLRFNELWQRSAPPGELFTAGL